MNKAMIEDELRDCTNVIDLIGKANKLKREGANPVTVNNVSARFRKSLMSKVAKVPALDRRVMQSINLEPITYVQFEVENLNSAMVTLTANSIII